MVYYMTVLIHTSSFAYFGNPSHQQMQILTSSKIHETIEKSLVGGEWGEVEAVMGGNLIVSFLKELRTQNSENDLFNPNITFCISLNKYIKLINSFGLRRHLLRQEIVTGTDATLGCFKQNSFNIHII